MKIHIELNGVKLEKDFPTSWDDVTFKQFLKLVECGDDTTKIISLFTDIDESTLKLTKIYNLEIIISLLSFLKTDVTMTIPTKCMGYAIPKNLELETIGQFEDLKAEAVQIAGTNNFEKYALFCAIYATNPYDYKEAEKLSEVFLNAPCGEVLGIGNFTLRKLAGLIQGSKAKFPKVNIHKKNFLQVLTAYLKSLVFILPFYIWKKKPRLTERKY